MTAALYDEVVTPAPAPKLTVVRDTGPAQATTQVSEPKKATRRVGLPFGGDPLVDGATRLLSIPLRHVYAALWRVGVLEVRA
jgi:hypothetical protein